MFSELNQMIREPTPSPNFQSESNDSRADQNQIIYVSKLRNELMIHYLHSEVPIWIKWSALRSSKLN